MKRCGILNKFKRLHGEGRKKRIKKWKVWGEKRSENATTEGDREKDKVRAVGKEEIDDDITIKLL